MSRSAIISLISVSVIQLVESPPPLASPTAGSDVWRTAGSSSGSGSNSRALGVRTGDEASDCGRMKRVDAAGLVGGVHARRALSRGTEALRRSAKRTGWPARLKTSGRAVSSSLERLQAVRIGQLIRRFTFASMPWTLANTTSHVLPFPGEPEKASPTRVGVEVGEVGSRGKRKP